MIEDNLHAMVDLARAHGIRVVLASVLPVSEYPWMPGITPAPKVRALNSALKRYADAQHLVYLDYYAPMANVAGGLDPPLAADGVHPTAKGYAVMRRWRRRQSGAQWRWSRHRTRTAQDPARQGTVVPKPTTQRGRQGRWGG